jgi:IS5 family transposase
VDREVHQSQAARGRLIANGRSGDSGLWLSNHISIDHGFGFIRKWAATDAAAYEGARLREDLLDKTNTAAGVWADTAYRSATNETFMQKNGFASHVHRKKTKGRPLPEPIRRANAAKSKIRSHVEHVFAEQKDRMELFIRKGN